MLKRSTSGRATLGADRGYDTRDFVAALRGRGVTPHVARNDRRRRSAVDGRTTRHAGYGLSQRRRKLVEEVFGWLKTGGRRPQAALRGPGAQPLVAGVRRGSLQPRAHGQTRTRPGIGALRPATAQEGAEAPGRPLDRPGDGHRDHLGTSASRASGPERTSHDHLTARPQRASAGSGGPGVLDRPHTP